MTKRMLIDASHAEETRVVVLDGNRLEDFDLEAANRLPLKGNIYLAKVVRVEPSLQAAFVEYGGNRHGFLPLAEIHPDYYQIPVADRQRLLEMQAAEARDTSDVLALVADDYADAQGRDRTRLRGALAAFFAMHPKLELLVDIESVEFPADGLAQARVTVRGLDTSRFDFGESVALDVELRRAGGEWRVARADRAER